MGARWRGPGSGDGVVVFAGVFLVEERVEVELKAIKGLNDYDFTHDVNHLCGRLGWEWCVVEPRCEEITNTTVKAQMVLRNLYRCGINQKECPICRTVR